MGVSASPETCLRIDIFVNFYKFVGFFLLFNSTIEAGCRSSSDSIRILKQNMVNPKSHAISTQRSLALGSPYCFVQSFMSSWFQSRNYTLIVWVPCNNFLVFWKKATRRFNHINSPHISFRLSDMTADVLSPERWNSVFWRITFFSIKLFTQNVASRL